MRTLKTTPEQIAKMQALREAGWSTAKIAKECKVSTVTVRLYTSRTPGGFGPRVGTTRGG